MLHVPTRALKRCGAFGSCVAVTVCTVSVTKSVAQSAKEGQPQPRTVASSTSNASPIYGVTIPPGYRDWKLIAVDQLETGKIDQLRAQLGNEIAIKAFKEGKVPFPDGAIIAAPHWTRVPSEDNNKVLAGPFPGAQSYVIGSAVNVQFMVKDSKKYAATGGWGFADFKDGKPGDEALHKPASPATSLPKLTTSFSPITHLRPEEHRTDRAAVLSQVETTRPLVGSVAAVVRAPRSQRRSPPC